MIFLNIVFQTSYEKCFIVKREHVWQSWFVYQWNIAVLVCFYSENFAFFGGLSQDLSFLCFVINFPGWTRCLIKCIKFVFPYIHTYIYIYIYIYIYAYLPSNINHSHIIPYSEQR